ncbi:MAG: DUF2127 domain-containing protein [Candidatus Dormibacteraeota bacterium]|nr:DUF2127 domain-containing protein [Candidatus Dormibacteraeota bacterium]
MQRIAAVVRWEMRRRITVTLGIRLIILDRFVKAVVLVFGGVALLILSRTDALSQLADHLQTELDLNPGSHLWLRLTDYLVQHLSSLGSGGEVALAVGAFCYGLLECLEGIGLVLRRRWAEYLVLLATGAFIPLEIDELVRRPTVWKAIALLINIAIIVYLIRRKRLFIDRPPMTLDPAP